jgi:ribosome biogenesis GTPase A
MGTTTQDNYKIISLDIDNKEDKDDIFNGIKKWKELLKEHNINNCVSFNTFIQQTGNCGFHYLFKVSNEQYENIKNITNFKIGSVSYCIDVKANENSFLVVEPSNYCDDKGTNKYYCWLKNDNIDICINSLLMLQKIPVEELKNYVVYIDEIASFIECLTHNKTLDTNINLIYKLLVKIIKHSKKLIVSDALINDGIFELLKHRNDDTKLFLINEYKYVYDAEELSIDHDEKIVYMTTDGETPTNERITV